MYKSIKAGAFPKNPPSCPDYWEAVPHIDSAGNLTYYCSIPSYFSSTDISNLMYYNSGNKSIASSDYIVDACGNQYINFTSGNWTTKPGRCNKYQWATTNTWTVNNSTPISWDGVTNTSQSPC